MKPTFLLLLLAIAFITFHSEVSANENSKRSLTSSKSLRANNGDISGNGARKGGDDDDDDDDDDNDDDDDDQDDKCEDLIKSLCGYCKNSPDRKSCYNTCTAANADKISQAGCAGLGGDDDHDDHDDDDDEGPRCGKMVEKMCKYCKKATDPALCVDGCIDRNTKILEKVGCNSTFFGGGLDDDDLNNNGKDDDDEHEDKCEKFIEKLCKFCKKSADRPTCYNTCIADNADLINKNGCTGVDIDDDDDDHDDDDDNPRCGKMVEKMCKYCKKATDPALCVDGCVDRNTKILEKVGCNSTFYGGGLDDDDLNNNGKDDDDEHEDKCEKFIERLCKFCKKSADRPTCYNTCIADNADLIDKNGCKGVDIDDDD